jgi:hypothetical protein
MEMNVVLRTILRHLTIETTTAPAEKLCAGGLGFLAKDGGRVVVHRRQALKTSLDALKARPRAGVTIRTSI